jgi:hypothetical protein
MTIEITVTADDITAVYESTMASLPGSGFSCGLA